MTLKPMRRAASCVILALELVGCAHQAQTIVTRSCVPETYPQPPTYSDTPESLKAAPDFATRYQLLAGNFFARNDRLQSDEKIIAQCR